METKDIQYFLDAENAFKEAHSEYGKPLWDEKYGYTEVGQEDRANFLMHKPFDSNLSRVKQLKQPLGKELEYGLTIAERVLLFMYYAKDSGKFRDDYYYDKANMPEVITAMFEGLNNLVQKAPQNKDSILYRFCCYEEPKNFKVGEVVTFPYNLTCTNNNWNQGDLKNVYVIIPLPNGETKAHNLFEIYNHAGENQVDFLRGTTFKVTKVENTKGSKYKKYYLTELKSEE